jgi:RimJ/RimL family protein N-acetyltransferase
MNATPTLKGDGVVLRPLALGDAEALFIAYADPETQKYRLHGPHANVAETARYIADTLAKGRGWAITETGGEALGRIALRTPEPGIGEIGIALRRAVWRQRLGSRAVRLVEHYAFAELGLTRLRANVDSQNAASLALFEHAGFVRGALMPASAITHNGVRDTVIMAKQLAP